MSLSSSLALLLTSARDAKTRRQRGGYGPWRPPRFTQARGANQLFASAMTTLKHARPPLDVWHFDARFHGRPRFSDRVIPRPTALTYLEPGPPGVYHPFASRYFAKLPGVPARCSRKKKSSRGRTTLNVSREKWPSLLNARRASAGSGERHGRERKAPPSLSVGARGRAPRRFAGRARLDDSAANPGARSHCLHAPHWIVTSTRVGGRRATCVSPRVT